MIAAPAIVISMEAAGAVAFVVVVVAFPWLVDGLWKVLTLAGERKRREAIFLALNAAEDEPAVERCAICGAPADECSESVEVRHG